MTSSAERMTSRNTSKAGSSTEMDEVNWLDRALDFGTSILVLVAGVLMGMLGRVSKVFLDIKTQMTEVVVKQDAAQEYVANTLQRIEGEVEKLREDQSDDRDTLSRHSEAIGNLKRHLP